MSDLHTDFRGARGIPQLAPGAGLVLVAGDTCQGAVKAVEQVSRAYPETEVAVIAGNHEYYGFTLGDELEAARERARQLGVHFMENDTAVFGRLRVIAATGWTDYDLFGDGLREAAMRTASDVMLDHKKIKWRSNPWQRFRPQEARALHLASRSYIETELAKEHAGPTLVMMHHAATIEAVAPRFQRSIVSAAYASELLPVVDRYQPEWFLTGHTHHSFSMKRGPTRMISNPCGYADENPFFNPLFTIEVDHD